MEAVGKSLRLIKFIKKTEYMKFSQGNNDIRHGESLEVEGHIFCRVLKFKYL